MAKDFLKRHDDKERKKIEHPIIRIISMLIAMQLSEEWGQPIMSYHISKTCENLPM